jgi:NAD(P)-dependent dehydrogenase (short-subunit alcohol dehydrogenase family)
MASESDKEKNNKLQDNVILIINGLSQSGGVLAKMLAQQGADVAIIDFVDAPALSLCIQQDVEKIGRRCLVLTPNPMEIAPKGFAQQAIKIIIDNLGRLDAFIAYAADDDGETAETAADGSGSSQLTIFDQHDLTKAALKNILLT